MNDGHGGRIIGVLSIYTDCTYIVKTVEQHCKTFAVFLFLGVANIAESGQKLSNLAWNSTGCYSSTLTSADIQCVRQLEDLLAALTGL